MTSIPTSPRQYLLPAPVYLGLPEKFDRWRPDQDRAVLRALDSDKRTVVQCAPTGFGKTVVYIAQALLSGRRTAVLTATKGLQSQLSQDFAECGLLDIRGQGNYRCKALEWGGEFHGEGVRDGMMCDAGPCHVGAHCGLRNAGCHYFDHLTRIRTARLVVTNYSYWIAQHRYSDGLGKFDLLVMDESHDAADELASSMETEISEFDTRTILGLDLPPSEVVAEWKEWGEEALDRAQEQEAQITDALEYSSGRQRSALYRERYRVRNIMRRVDVAASMEGDWVIERRAYSAKLAPVWPAPYTERYLFLGIPKLVLVSATIRPKSLDMLGITPGTYEFMEHRSTFPVARRPVVQIPTVRVKHTWTEVEQRFWVNRIDQIIDQRLDRKGLVHCMSYERRDLILNWSRHRDIMLANDPQNTRTTVERFRSAAAPCVLVSPSLTTGWDLPAEDCEYAIIAKIPFPDTRSVITAARTQQDPDYGPYVAMQTIVQASGRGMRSATDSCEVLIIDDQWRWFWPKYKHFAPGWFKEAVSRSATIPVPLPKL